MMKTRNDAGVLNARRGIVNGKKCVFTHRNPASGDVWAEDYVFYVGGEKRVGRWFKADQVKFID